MKKYYCLYRLNKSGGKKYLTWQSTFKLTKTNNLYRSFKKEKCIGVREYIECLTGYTLFIEEAEMEIDTSVEAKLLGQ